MKAAYLAAIGIFMAVSAGAQGLPGMDKLKKKAAAAVAESGGLAYTAAAAAFNKAVKDIPFANNSSELSLSDPKFSVEGVNLDDLMKKTVIPALVKALELAPADKQVTITGHASKKGTEEASGSFQGNIALSKARAEAVVKYLVANSSLKEERLKVVAAGSSAPLPDTDPAADKNCRVSIKMD